MKRQLTLGEYRAIDLTILALMLALFEGLIIRFATGSFYGTVSLAAAVTAIVYMRWSWWGAIHAALSGALFCLYYSMLPGAQSVTWRDYAIYMGGNLVSLLAVFVLHKVGKERVRESALGSLGFGLGVIALMQGGRMAIALALGRAASTVVWDHFLYDSLSILFTLVVIWIVRRLDGVFEDQKHYLLRLQEESQRNNTEQ